MAGAYLINRKAAAAMLKHLQKVKCNDIIDWWHNSLYQHNVIQIYWLHPPIIEQGSHNGLLQGSISSKSQSLQRRISWYIQRFYKTYIKRLLPEEHIIEP
jgi:glycosyl transferase family 25